MTSTGLADRSRATDLFLESDEVMRSGLAICGGETDAGREPKRESDEQPNAREAGNKLASIVGVG